MTILGLACILVAAFLHASWNLIAKRAQGGAVFTWLIDTCGVVVWAPVVLGFVIATQPQFTLTKIGVISVSVLFQVGYLWSLQRGYRVGDFSLVYPIARGTGAGGAVIGAIFLLGEDVTIFGALGILCLLAGILILTIGKPKSSQTQNPAWKGVAFGLLTGLFIMSYTLWDKNAVTDLAIAPIVLYYGVLSGRALLLTPLALRSRDTLRMHWQNHRKHAISIAILMTLSYVLVLTALTFTPASSVAPAREISILFGTLMGQQLLAEQQGKQRIIAASLIVCGLATIVAAGTP
jgi:drug/metabolite transporter (DMT)-like permease